MQPEFQLQLMRSSLIFQFRASRRSVCRIKQLRIEAGLDSIALSELLVSLRSIKKLPLVLASGQGAFQLYIRTFNSIFSDLTIGETKSIFQSSATQLSGYLEELLYAVRLEIYSSCKVEDSLGTAPSVSNFGVDQDSLSGAIVTRIMWL